MPSAGNKRIRIRVNIGRRDSRPGRAVDLLLLERAALLALSVMPVQYALAAHHSDGVNNGFLPPSPLFRQPCQPSLITDSGRPLAVSPAAKP